MTQRSKEKYVTAAVLVGGLIALGGVCWLLANYPEMNVASAAFLVVLATFLLRPKYCPSCGNRLLRRGYLSEMADGTQKRICLPCHYFGKLRK